MRDYDVMTSRRRYVIEIGHHFYFLPCALVQSTIPPNLVRISQQTKKFIGLQDGRGGGGVVVVVVGGSSTVLSYILQPGVVRFSDCCFDSVGVSFRVGGPCHVVNQAFAVGFY